MRVAPGVLAALPVDRKRLSVVSCPAARTARAAPARSRPGGAWGRQGPGAPSREFNEHAQRSKCSTVALACLAGFLAAAGWSCQESSRAAPARARASATSSSTRANATPSASGRKQSTGATSVPVSASTIAPTRTPMGRCPSDMALVGRACVDRYEAHLVRLGPDGQEFPHPPYLRPERGAVYRARSEPGVMPQAYVNRKEALDACRRSGKRLCTLGEWYRACTGTAGHAYPYGAEFEPGRCNTGKPHLLGKLFGEDPRQWKYEEHFNSPRLDQEPGFLALTGAYRSCTSDAGTYDMVGNLHEWISDQVDYDLPNKIPLRDDIRAKIGANYGKGIFMGGFFSTTAEHGRGCRFLTPGHGWKYHDYSTGFRCCRDAAP